MNKRTFVKGVVAVFAAIGLPLPTTKNKTDELIPSVALYVRTGDTFIPYSMGVNGDAVQSVVMYSGIDGAFDWVAFDKNGITLDWSDREYKKPHGYFVSLPDTSECLTCDADGGGA